MSTNSMFDAIPLVTTPLSLVAFLAAVAVLAHARAIGRAEKLIKTAPDQDRRTLVAGALEILDLKASKLSKEQTYELALETLRHRRLRSVLTFFIVIAIALIFGGLAVYSVINVEPTKVINDLLSSKDKRNTVIGELRQQGIFEVSDADLVKVMIEKTAIPKEEERELDDQSLIKLATKKYESVASVKELRRRAAVREEPFRPIGESLVATVPSGRDDQPRQFFVYVPKGSTYTWRSVKLTNPENGKYLRLLAKPAIDEDSRGTDMHINKEQAAYIFGGPLIPAKLSVIVRETIEPIFDPNCSTSGRAKRFNRVASLSCQQGNSVETTYLINTLSQ